MGREVSGLLQRLHVFAIAHPRTVLLLAAVVVAAMSPGLLRLRLRTDGNALVPPDAPEVRYDRTVRDYFGIEDQTVVMFDTQRPDGIYEPESLRRFVRLAERLGKIDGLLPHDVTHLAAEKSDRVRPGTLTFRTLLDPFPDNERLMSRLRRDIDEIAIYRGTLVASDDSALAILLATPRDVDRAKFHVSICEAIDEQGVLPERVYIAGAPIAESQLGTHILEDLLGTHGLRLLARLGMTQPAGEAFRPGGRVRVSLIAVSLLVMAVVFFAAFRSIAAVVLPLLEVGACLVFTFSLMGWCSVPVYLTIAVLPVILTAIGVADELHIFTRYRRALRDHRDGAALDPLRLTMREMWRPVTITSVTSAIGFLSFALSPIAPVRAFGIFTAVGIAFCLLWSLTVVPASLSLIDPSRIAGRGRATFAPVALGRFGAAALGRQRWILVGAAVVIAVSPFGIRRLVVQDSWVDAFSPGSALRDATDRVNHKFDGVHLLLVDFDTGPLSFEADLARDDISERTVSIDGSMVDDPGLLAHHKLTVYAVAKLARARGRTRTGDRLRERRVPFSTHVVSAERLGDRIIIHTDPADTNLDDALAVPGAVRWTLLIEPETGRLLQPSMLDRVGALESFIEARKSDAVGGVQGYHEILSTANYLVHGRREGTRRSPESARSVSQCLKRYKRIRGEKRLRQLVDTRNRRCLMTVFLKDANFVATARLMEAIREYEREHLTGEGVRLGFSGDVAVSQAMIGAIVRTQTQSLLLSLMGIVAVTALLSRSLVWGLFCVVPAAMAVLINFTMMGLTATPLGVATSMFSGMTIGVGVDYAIHFLERARLGAGSGLGVRDTVLDAMSHAGPAILIDGVAIAMGFGVLILSQVPANRRLGGLVVLAVVTCLIATFVLLPALLMVVRPRFLADVRPQTCIENDVSSQERIC